MLVYFKILKKCREKKITTNKVSPHSPDTPFGLYGLCGLREYGKLSITLFEPKRRKEFDSPLLCIYGLCGLLDYRFPRVKLKIQYSTMECIDYGKN